MPVLPYGLGANQASGAPRAPAPIDTPSKMDTSYSTKITETLIAHVPDEAVDHYEFAPLFVEIGKQDEYTVWSLWDLNAKLMSVATDRKRKVRGKDPSTFPCTIAEFQKRFKFAGFQTGSIQQNPAGNNIRFKTNRRIFTVQLQGELHNYPNIWGAAARCGYDIGFHVCYVNRGGREASAKRDWRGAPFQDGNGDMEVTETRALQVVPIVCKGGNVPLETLPLCNEKYPTHSKEAVRVQFKGKVGDKIVDKSAMVEITAPACFIYVGRVARLMGTASDYDVENARSSATAYKNLAVMRSQIDIEMIPYGKNLKWVL